MPHVTLGQGLLPYLALPISNSSQILPDFLVRHGVPDPGALSVLREVTYARSHGLTRQS